METFLSGFAKSYTAERARVQDAKREDEKEARALKLRADERMEDYKIRREERDSDRAYQTQKDAADAAQRASERAADRASRKAELTENRTYESEKERRKGFMEQQKTIEQRKYDRENFTLKYGLEALTKNKTKRDEKMAETKLLAEQASYIAQKAGIPDAAADILNDAKIIGIQKAEERAVSGHYKRNPDYVEPERTVKVPTAVSQASFSTGMPEVDAQIDSLDPTLRQIAEDDTKTALDTGTSRYVYKPDNTEKIGSYAQASYDYQKAVQSNDAKAAADAKLQMQIHEGILTQEALAESKAKGTNTKSYVMLNENGEIESQFAGELRPTDGGEALFNVSNPDVDAAGNRIAKPVMGKAVPLDEDGTKMYFDLVRDVGKQQADFNTSNDKYVGALSTMDTIQQVLARNPAVTTMSSNVAVLTKGMQDEAGGLYTLIANEQAAIDQAIASGDPNIQSTLPKMIADNEKNLKDFQTNFMGQANTNLAYDKALYEGQRKLLAYQMAAANGITGAGLNKKDYDNFYEATGGNKSAPEVMAAMGMTAKGVLSTIDSARDTLSHNPQIEKFEGFYKIKTGLTPLRLEEKIRRMGPEYAHLIPVLSGINRSNAEGRQMAVQSVTQDTPVVPEIGTVEDGFEFKGGDPADFNNWKEVK